MQNIHINKLEIPHFIIKHASPYAHRWFTYNADDVSHLKKITNTINLLLAVNVSLLKMCWLIQLEAILNYKKITIFISPSVLGSLYHMDWGQSLYVL